MKRASKNDPISVAFLLENDTGREANLLCKNNRLRKGLLLAERELNYVLKHSKSAFEQAHRVGTVADFPKHITDAIGEVQNNLPCGSAVAGSPLYAKIA